MRYDMKCNSCGWEGERACKAADRHVQGCAQPLAAPDPTRPELTHCGGRLEVLISSDTSITRFGFGFAPSLVREDGTKVPGHERRRPASVKRGS